MANQNLFNSVQLQKPNRNRFDLSHDVKLSLNMGKLYPILAQECVPGDHFKLSCQSLLRFAPLIAPVMHRMDVTMHYFFVPNRLIWSGWEDWITNENTTSVHPYVMIDRDSYDFLPLPDYLGLPRPGATTPYKANAFQMAAYQCVYSNYYRDENLVPKFNFELVSGDNSTNSDLWQLRTRAWQHDYFTAALPFAQKGAAVELPVGKLTDVEVYRNRTDASEFTWNATKDPGGTPDTVFVDGFPAGADSNVLSDHLFAKVSDAELEATTINELRRAIKLQEWLERNARGGTRYTEHILAHFGVRSSDARLQRPEYITGTKSPVVISEVLNNTGEDGGLPQGNMAGHGVSVTSGKYGSYFCEEHGFIIGVMSVLPMPAYQQGIPRSFLRQDKFDYFWPEFAHIGEQEVFNKELYVEHPDPNGTFGYVPRYSEYKYMPSRVCGDFKTSLNYWHLGRIFDTPPNLNQAFVECNPSDRIFAVTDPTVDKLYAQVLNVISAIRPMPKFGTPSI